MARGELCGDYSRRLAGQAGWRGGEGLTFGGKVGENFGVGRLKGA